MITSLLAESSISDWVSVGVSGFLSIVLIVVTIITAKINCRVQDKIAKANQESANIGKETAQLTKEAAMLPLKLEIMDSLSSFDKHYYDVCTKLFLIDSISIKEIDWAHFELDDMITQIYADEIKLRAVCSTDDNFYKIVDRIYLETKQLYRLLGQCKDKIVGDLTEGRKKLKDVPQLKICKDLVADVFKNEVNFNLYICNMDRKTIDFIKQYIVVYDDLDKINYKDLMDFNNQN